ncbi:hypothetical protein OsI_31744 [Oryza sativa Indica Group]|uniref:Pentatricopeptide repeat-containing protein n=1 Tax=Oryza sativa subsp. indica TaxID=39946 RepID=A2Z2B1_ORYSI|nr:hypothetical protein OsI_31744 [Oryza sativa Indica Group]
MASSIPLDEQTFLSMLKSERRSVGKQVHVHVEVSGLHSSVYLRNSLIKMYLDAGDVEAVEAMFRCTPTADTVSCNIMLSGYVKGGCGGKALRFFCGMASRGIGIDQYSVHSCCSPRLLRAAEEGSSWPGKRKTNSWWQEENRLSLSSRRSIAKKKRASSSREDPHRRRFCLRRRRRGSRARPHVVSKAKVPVRRCGWTSGAQVPKACVPDVAGGGVGLHCGTGDAGALHGIAPVCASVAPAAAAAAAAS